MTYALSSYRAQASDAYAMQDAREIARQNCCDGDYLKNLTTCITALAIAVFGSLLIMEWPILMIIAAPIVGIYGYEFIRDHICCST